MCMFDIFYIKMSNINDETKLYFPLKDIKLGNMDKTVEKSIPFIYLLTLEVKI